MKYPYVKSCLATGLFGLGAALCVQAGTLQQDLVAHFAFDGNVDDSIGNISPTIKGGASADGEGKLGSNSFRFWSYKSSSEVPEGEEQFNYLQLTSDSEVGDPNGVLDFGTETDFSVAFWVKFSNWTGDPSFFSNKDWGSGGNTGYVIATAGDGHIQWNYREAGSSRKDYDSPAGLLGGGAWHHLAVTFKRSGNATIYLDGAKLDSRAIVTNDPDGNWTPLSLASGLAVNIGQDGKGTYTDGGDVGIADGRIDDFGIWRRELAEAEISRLYAAGIAGINLANVPDPTTPALSNVSPTAGSLNSNPNGAFSATIEDANTALNVSSVKVKFDGVVVAHKTASAGPGKTLVTFEPSSILEGGSSHTYEIEYSDNGAPVTTKKQTIAFTVGTYTNLVLPAPIMLETFDGVGESELPAGWSVKNYTGSLHAGPNLDDPQSDSYLDFVVISQGRLNSVFGNRRNSVAPWQVVNGKVLTSLSSGNLIYAESDNRSGNQYQILYSPDFDLTGKTDIYLSFHSLYEQNQDSLGSVEYSIDEGITWEPVLYMIDRVDIKLNDLGEIDAQATLSATYSDVAKFTDPDTGISGSGNYGSFLGVTEDRWADLGSYISGRVDDNAVESKRVETYRLPLADNQPKVRLRFAQAGTGSWYFGLDDIGLYSIPASTPTVAIASASGKVTITFSGGKLQSAPSVNGPWTEVQNAASPLEVAPSAAQAFYRTAQ